MFSFGGAQNNNTANNNNNNNTGSGFSFGGFGTNNNTNSNQPQQQQQQQQQNLFSGQQSFQTQQQQQQQQQLQQSQQQQRQPDPIERLTRVSDLPNDAQNLIEQLNQHILQQISISDQVSLNEEGLGETVDSVSTDVKELQRRWGSTNSFLLNDQTQLEGLRDQVHADAENLLISTRFVDGIRSGNLNVRGSADHILKYFFATASEIESDIQKYDKIVSAIEKHVLYVKDQRLSQDAETLVAALKAQHAAYMRLATKVATVHDRVTQEVQ